MISTCPTKWRVSVNYNDLPASSIYLFCYIPILVGVKYQLSPRCTTLKEMNSPHKTYPFRRFHPCHNSPLHKNWTYHCLLFQLILKPLGWSLNTGQRWCQICAESPQWCEMWNSARHWRKNVWRDHFLGVPSWKNFQFSRMGGESSMLPFLP